MTEQYAQQYQKLYPVFHQMGLSEFDAQECVMALLSQLSEQTLKCLRLFYTTGIQLICLKHFKIGSVPLRNRTEPVLFLL